MDNITPPDVKVGDFDANANFIKLLGAHIDNRPDGPFFAKNYLSCLQVFDSKQHLPLSTRPGFEHFRGDSSQTQIEHANPFLRYRIPFNMFFYNVAECGGCNATGSMEFVDCAALLCERYGHICNDMTGWNEIKCQYRCKQCTKFTVFIERTFVFIQSGYYELSARPYDASTLTVIEDKDSKWHRCTPDYWLGEKENGKSGEQKTWDGTCFCCGKMTKMMVAGTETHVGGSGQHSSSYGSTFCTTCNLKYEAAEHD